DADADGGQIAGDGQGHADHAALGGGVGDLTDLTVEGGHRRDGDDGAPLVRVERLGLAHGGGGQTHAVEGADQVHLEHLLVGVQVEGRVVLTVAPDGAGGPADAGCGDEGPERAEVLGRLHRLDDLLGVGHVGLHEHAVELLGHRLTLLRVHVDDDGPGATGGELSGGGFTEARGAAGDDR